LKINTENDIIMTMTASPESISGHNPNQNYPNKELVLSLVSDNAPLPQQESLVSDDKFHYELLVEHRRTDGSYKTNDQLRSEYVKRTDELIRVLTEGVNVEDPDTKEKTVQIPDYVIWLDKSARPVAWLTKELWPKLAPTPGRVVPKMPESRFVNIDREQWKNAIDLSGSSRVEIDKLDKSIIRSLRSIFVQPKYKQNGLSESIDEAPSELDGNTILIVDEVNASGKTLEIAQGFFRRAFPHTRIAGVHWMGGQTAQMNTGGTISMGNVDLPVWYREDTALGRGVGNRDDRISSKSPSITQKLGSTFLSTRHLEKDELSDQLRKELKQLAHDPEVLIIPSTQRIDFEERAIALNGLASLQDYVAKKKALDAQEPKKKY
jgi:hypothetical protein